MNMPGFTAEFSISGTNNYYGRSAYTHAVNAIARDINPQLELARTCIPGCVCFSPFGCPCCYSIIRWPFPGWLF
jgi:hypothetical protein